MVADPRAGEHPLDPLPQAIAGGVEIMAARALADPDEARDAVQETLARAVEAIRQERIPPGVPLAAFVHGIARHVIVDVIRRRRRESAAGPDPDTVPSATPDSLEVLVREERVSLVRRALARLPSNDRDILARCFIDGQRVTDIARESGEPPERVRKRKSRALERLRNAVRALERGHTSPPPPTSRS